MKASARDAAAPGIAAVRRACAYIAAHATAPLTLKAVAEQVGLSPSHFQRTFTRVTGISPRAYHEAVRAGRFRDDLRRGAAVAAAIYDAGYGSTSRVYERKPTSGPW